IGFVLDDTLDKPDGVQQYVLTLGAHFTGQGHEVHYLVGETTRKDIANVHSLARNIKVRFNQNRLSIPLPSRKSTLKLLLETQAYDVIHVQMPFSPQMGGRIIAAVPHSTAVVATFHILPYSVLEKVASRLLATMQTSSLKRIDQVVSVSEPAAVFAKAAFSVDSVVVPNAVDIKKFSRGRALEKYKDNFVILFLGRLVERKGVLQLLKAVAAKKDFLSQQNVKVVVCGKGPLGSKVQRYIKEKDLETLVNFVGFIEEAEKPDYLASADVAVFPSISGESFGIVLIEAMAAGSKVVIGGNNPGYASVLAQNESTLFEPKSIKSFTEILEKFVQNEALCTEVHDVQQELVGQYDITVVAAQVMDVYKTAIAKRTNNI
ncbi:MAG: glycosyltransferase, partial [Candidatus Saccharibacteria bacterium]|nr:glycosyltransferase [Candidatus Saccharibacteria bacterium]